MSLVTVAPALTAIRAAAIDVVFVQIVDMHQSRTAQDGVGYLFQCQRQPWIAMPDDRPVAVSFVNHDHRVTVGRVAHDGMRRVDVRGRQRLADQPAVVIAAKGADVRRPQPERRARGERRRHLAPARDARASRPDASHWEPAKPGSR